MITIGINNKGIPPLAGICMYEEAFRPGYSVDICVDLLKRYNFIKKQLDQVMVAHLARTPEWEVKCAFGHHLWLDSEHCTMLRKRVSEMREPPLHLDTVADDRLQLLMEEVIRSNNTVELLTAIFQVVRPALIRSMQQHLDTTNPIADQPTTRILAILLMEERGMLVWAEKALESLLTDENNRVISEQWRDHLNAYLTNAGGISGKEQENLNQERAASTLPRPRFDGSPYEMDPKPRRDERFVDPFNQSGNINEYYQDESLSAVERTYALIYKRLREMDVPEWMGPILYKTKDKPWEYYADLSRQLWDEIRHAMLGEIGLAERGIPFYKYPVELKSSMVLNIDFEPMEAHLILWAIEQDLMHNKRGKRWEWEISKLAGIPFAVTLQDYDWADEVLHAQIGRKWIVPEFDGVGNAIKAGAEMIKAWRKEQEKMIEWSGQEHWWPKFMTEVNESLSKQSN